MKVKIENIHGAISYVEAKKITITEKKINIYVAGDTIDPFRPIYWFELKENKMYDMFFGTLKTLWIDGEIVYKNE